MPAPQIDAGALDKRVTLLQPVYNEFEDEITGYVPVADVWAGINPIYPQEQGEAGRIIATVMVTVTIRYRTDLDDRWRIQDRDLTYEIKGMLDVMRRHVQLQLNCLEVK
jgi:SPP1 family predicted phage head-tail adaptor